MHVEQALAEYRIESDVCAVGLSFKDLFWWPWEKLPSQASDTNQLALFGRLDHPSGASCQEIEW
ncbi:uncharacterized protein N7525_010069 [Penicillium rubens]|jgi:hypothetical protein|uniref:uncharacterized protein n=1 Tax=Penicillium rubens TaxID=1108849 RepID=UPI002A5B0745|nr:uncharacterized protein N7525_010069 [Penicillium rubens]KAJ5820785.1 hypothetical protein N7525_010069 [Penicillium rubens]